MKTKLLALLLAFTGIEIFAQVPAVPGGATKSTGLGRGRQPIYSQQTLAAAAAATSTNNQSDEMIPQGLIDFSGADATQVLEVYARLVNRTLLRAAVPEAKIILKTQTPLTRSEAIQALQALLAMNNISVINIGDKFVKVVTSDKANTAGAELDRSGSTNLPNMGTYITHIHQLKYVKPKDMIPLITPFSNLQGGLLGLDDNGILVIRDYAENVKRMLEMIEQIDVSVPAEFISEVIPIRYAKVDEIASALQSLGGSGGGSTVSIGSAPSSTPISGFGNRSGGISGINGGGGGYGNQGSLGGGGLGGGGLGARQATTPSGGANATSFQDRLKNIINKAGSSGGAGGGQQDQIQLFGQTKIIPNESSSTLLIYATRQDMAMIKEIIGKLDVPLAQVLVEALIMNVSIGNQFNLGISAAQNPQSLGGSILGGGGINNGPSFANFVKTITTTTNGLGQITGTASSIASSLGTNGGAFASALPGGMSYFANLGPNYELAVKAAESDSHASIIQRPRLLASQSKPAQFFVGETRPYVTSTYNNGYSGGYGGSSYSQLSVGVELDVTPFINPDGEVTMDIQQEVDDFAGTTTIAGVGEVPNTTKRTLNTSITVRDRDTVMLGGFIKSDKSTSKSGVPFLVDIPLLGNLFSSRNDVKDRSELVVLLRPTVMRTPKLVAEQTIRETQRLPGVAGAAAEDAAYEHKLVEAERRRELRAAKTGANTNGFFNVLVPAELPPSGFPTNAFETPVAPGAMLDPTPASNVLEPSGESMKQAEAVRQEVVATAKAAPTYTPAQKKKLDAALNSYMAGKISAEEYKAAKVKILADPK
jgi:general secretion pathway protein D